ncbi:MAG: hypothetical protein NVS1B4_08500 [Gemmatimonadaceae bacterium]
MFPSSLVVILAGLTTVAIALGAFLWAWRRGHLGQLEAQSRVVLDERDVRLERPWETAQQRADRARHHGALVPPLLGEWGDGA